MYYVKLFLKVYFGMLVAVALLIWAIAAHAGTMFSTPDGTCFTYEDNSGGRGHHETSIFCTGDHGGHSRYNVYTYPDDEGQPQSFSAPTYNQSSRHHR